MEKKTGVIRQSFAEGDPSFARISHPERKVANLPIKIESLADGVNPSDLQRGQEVEYEWDGARVRNLHPIGPAPVQVQPALRPQTKHRPAARTPTPDTGVPTAGHRQAEKAKEAKEAKEIKKADKSTTPGPKPAPGTDVCTAIKQRDLDVWEGAAPYTFVPVVTESGASGPVEEVVLHDGIGAKDRYSGELRVELEALTPLLVGQYRYRWSELKHDKGEPVLTGDCTPQKAILEPALLQGQDSERKLIPPRSALTETDWKERRVLIPGSSLKGAIRQNISAMLNAPMERVAERYYSYRPNLDATRNEGKTYGTFAAVVDEVRLDKDGAICGMAVYWVTKPNVVRFVESPRAAYLGKDRADEALFKKIKSSLVPGELLTAGKLRHFSKNENDHYRFSQDCPPLQSVQPNTKIYSYATGIDGACELAQIKADKDEERNFKHLFRALVSDSELSTKRIEIEEAVVRQHTRTLVELADPRAGHLARLPGSPSEDQIKEFSKLIDKNQPKENQLIYIEAELDKNGDPLRVVSFGTHFRYRWRYADSVREIEIDPETGKGKVRSQLEAPEDERIKSEQNAFVSGALSGARLLFGFVADKDAGTADIGEEDFTRFAGRIAINHAVEHLTPDRSEPKVRFLFRDGPQGDARFLIPLRILGAPKPSAVEHYLCQDGLQKRAGATVTYGDLPGIESNGAELMGRKFYRHQSLQVGLEGPLSGKELFLAPDDETAASDQATLARLVSRPGTRFRYRVRFRDLRAWELGALLLAIEPDLVEQAPEELLPPKVREVMDRARKARTENGPLFAGKLGYARPLGLGSVRMTCKGIRLLVDDQGPQMKEMQETDLAKLRTDCLHAFLDKIDSRRIRLADWLEAVRFAGCELADYPRSRRDPKDKQETPTTYTYHTEIRKAHAKARRLPNPSEQKSPHDRPVRLYREMPADSG